MQHIEDFEAMMKHVWCYVAEDARIGVWPQSGLRGAAGLQAWNNGKEVPRWEVAEIQ